MLALALAAVVASAPSTLGDERLLVATARVSTNPKARRDKPVPNYGVIWDHKLTRSGQPSTLAGWTWLRRQGVRSVVNFRSENDVDYTRLGFEHSLWLPLKSSEPPTDADAERFLAFVRDPQNWPLHIHCKSGQDRTGVMAALVRYAIDGWTLERALVEARSYRGGVDLAPQDMAWLRQWAAGHEPGSHRLSLGSAGRSARHPTI
ncbi:MAG: hypothetical protein E6J79_11990 [Deltaproteobacteria bacterium]|nr:MAG: hypothetical protein E6J79_11990 [Deltaproteobacteria bacterium]